MSRERLLRALGLVVLWALTLGAGETSSQKQRAESDFWSSIARPGYAQFAAAVERGKKALASAGRSRARDLWRKTMQEALAAFREAIKARPGEPAGHYWTGRALYELERMKEAIAAFEKVRRLAPLFPEDYEISFSLGIAHSKLGRFDVAVQEYDRAERVRARGEQTTEARGARATLHGNAAEALMALGRLDESIQRYREALDLHPGYLLAWWGLAVALDRDEQVSKAMAAVQRATVGDPTMKRLTEPGVFFVPEGDVHYYRGLGYLAQGKTAAARDSFERFVRELPDSQWVARARDHLARLGAASEPSAGSARLAPTPSETEDGSQHDSSGRDRSNIRYRMRERIARVHACYQRELRVRKDLAGQLRVAFEVTPRGRTQNVQLLSSTLSRPSLHACVLKVIREASFGRLAGSSPVRMIYPFDFRPE